MMFSEIKDPIVPICRWWFGNGKVWGVVGILRLEPGLILVVSDRMITFSFFSFGKIRCSEGSGRQ